MGEQDFKPGDLVECVDASEVSPRRAPPGLEEGSVYTIIQIWTHARARCGWVVSTKELKARTLTGGFGVWRFRKVYRPDPKLIERLTAEPVFSPPTKQPGRVEA